MKIYNKKKRKDKNRKTSKVLKSAKEAIKEATKSEKSYVIFLADIKNFVADLVSELSTLTE